MRVYKYLSAEFALQDIETENIWWKYRQKPSTISRTTRVSAQTIRIRTKQALPRTH